MVPDYSIAGHIIEHLKIDAEHFTISIRKATESEF
jgi:hypothetical protein